MEDREGEKERRKKEDGRRKDFGATEVGKKRFLEFRKVVHISK